MTRALLLWSLPLYGLVACECGGELPPEDPPASSTLSAQDLFPRGLGDRWSYRSSVGPAVRRAITATIEAPSGDGPSTSVRFGSDHVHAMRFTAAPDGGVLLVDAHGEPLAIWLEEPVALETRWTYYRVAGAPAPPLPETLDCDAVLLLPSDVHAACTPALAATETDPVEGTCRYRFEAPAEGHRVRALQVDVTRPGESADLDAVIGERATPIERDGEVAFARPVIATGTFTEGLVRRELESAPGVVAFRIQVEGGACSVQHARRLAPLLRSLLRR